MPLGILPESRATRKLVVENRRYQGQAAEGFKPTHPNERGRGPRGQRRQLRRQQLGNLHASTIADFGRIEQRRDVILLPIFVMLSSSPLSDQNTYSGLPLRTVSSSSATSGG